jgi:hypothetical protein
MSVIGGIRKRISSDDSSASKRIFGIDALVPLPLIPNERGTKWAFENNQPAHMFDDIPPNCSIILDSDGSVAIVVSAELYVISAVTSSAIGVIRFPNHANVTR